jgi:hypothetical protein
MLLLRSSEQRERSERAQVAAGWERSTVVVLSWAAAEHTWHGSVCTYWACANIVCSTLKRSFLLAGGLPYSTSSMHSLCADERTSTSTITAVSEGQCTHT